MVSSKIFLNFYIAFDRVFFLRLIQFYNVYLNFFVVLFFFLFFFYLDIFFLLSFYSNVLSMLQLQLCLNYKAEKSTLMEFKYYGSALLKNEPLKTKTFNFLSSFDQLQLQKEFLHIFLQNKRYQLYIQNPSQILIMNFTLFTHC